MTSDGTVESYYETSHDVDVWRVDGPGAWEHLGHYGWSAPQGKWIWWLSTDITTLSDADRRAIAAATPTGDPVVRLDVKP